MNWQQLYTASTPEERLELLLDMLHVVETRSSPIVFAGGRLRRERRRESAAHYIRDRRGRYPTRALIRTLYMLMLGVVSLSVWLVALNIPREIAAPLVLAYAVMLVALLLINPARITLALLTRATEH